MAFESLSGYIDKIEEMLIQNKSPHAIASAIGQPQKWKTIERYREAVFNFRKAAVEQWDEEKKKASEQRFTEGKDKIIDNFELLNKLKARADYLLEFEAGDTYSTAEQTQVLTPGSVAKMYGEAAKLAQIAIKSELELAGVDPESRKARALEDLSDEQLGELIRALNSS